MRDPTPEGPAGTNYAVQAARCIPADLPPLNDAENPAIRIPSQVNAYLASVSGGSADPDALYVIYGGGNDVLDAVRMTTADNASLDGDVHDRLRLAARSCSDSARDLIDAGARNVIQVGVPNLGDIPRFTLIGDDAVEDVARELTLTFNTAMDAAIADVEDTTGIDIVQVDAFDSVKRAEDTAGLQTSEPCTISPYLGGIPEATPPIEPGMVPFRNCDVLGDDAAGFLFFDEIHPTTAGHKVAAREILRALRRATRDNKHFPHK